MDLIVSNSYSITNPELKKATNSIKGYANNIRKNFLRIAGKLAEVETNESYIEDGFGDVIEYACKVFNMKKTTAYNLLKIGREYVNPENMEKTILSSDKGDYTISQLGVLLPVGVDRVVELNNDGVISPEMTVRQLKGIVGTRDDVEPEGMDESEPQGDKNDDVPNEPTQIITLWGNGDVSFSGFDRCDENQLNELAGEIESIVNKYL